MIYIDWAPSNPYAQVSQDNANKWEVTAEMEIKPHEA